MSTYAQILQASSAGRRQLWYICGPEPALRQDALDLARTHAGSNVDTVATTILFGADVTAEDVLRRLSERVPEQRSVVVLLDAEKFKGWDSLLEILPKLPASDFFIAVSNESTADTTLPHIRMFMGKAKVRLVTCKPFDDKQMIDWIESRLHIKREATRYLIEKAQGDHEWVLNAIRKLSVLEGEINLNVCEALCSTPGNPSFVTSLLYYRKRSAILSLRHVEPNGGTVSLLSDSVMKALLLQDSIRSVGMFARELSERTHLTAAELARLKPIMKLYDTANGSRCLGAMRRLHPELASGNRYAWQALISRW